MFAAKCQDLMGGGIVLFSPNALQPYPCRSPARPPACPACYCTSLQWPMPPVRRLWRNSPTRVLSHFLGHEGPGGLFAALQDRDLATSVSAGLRTAHEDFSLFQARNAFCLWYCGVVGEISAARAVFRRRDVGAMRNILPLLRVFSVAFCCVRCGGVCGDWGGGRVQ